MKKNSLQSVEKEILQDFESGKLKPVENIQKEKERHQAYAAYTLRKSKSINIRLPERDLQRLKSIAAEKGLPYQTLISSLLHQYSSKKAGDVAEDQLWDEIARARDIKSVRYISGDQM